VIKSSEGDVCENITVTNCILSTSCSALKIGTESHAAIRNITFSNCVIRDSNVGLALYLKDGGSYENILFSNCVIESHNAFPIVVDHTPRFYKTPEPAVMRSISFENITIASPGRLFVEGPVEHPIENLSFSNINWTVTGPLEMENTKKPRGASRVEQDPDAPNYALHSHQLIAANVKNLQVRGFRVCCADGDASLQERGRLFLKNIQGGTVSGVTHWESTVGEEATVTEFCSGLNIGAD